MLHLASKSPRRRELLGRLGVPFVPLDLDIPEVRSPGESPEAYVRRVARDKARAGSRLLGGADAVLGADTEVVLDDLVFGKPADREDAMAMLRRLSGRTHLAISAVVLALPDAEHEAVAVTRVRFAPLSEERIAAYVDGGEAMGKAGAYAIQGAAEAFVERLEGSYSGVMGLPLYETDGLLRAAGLLPAVAGAAATAVAP
ncbi:Maf family protein [Luteimonas sp. RD2P54]|uniref:dTTP/UTP pyrophosphatase n=1 Tax=Luteimonas endophytica TaxID=3042023 RepID=A0ABT6J994_9GAMM|nr:Maf family protein [Luteimonas endophytica]MDH5823383.1 Maf family protein [Luteimonas endophytica]